MLLLINKDHKLQKNQMKVTTTKTTANLFQKRTLSKRKQGEWNNLKNWSYKERTWSQMVKQLDCQIEYKKVYKLILGLEQQCKVMIETPWHHLPTFSEELLVLCWIHSWHKLRKIVSSLKVRWLERQPRQSWRNIGIVFLARNFMYIKRKKKRNIKECIIWLACLLKRKMKSILINKPCSIHSRLYSLEISQEHTIYSIN